MRNHAVVIGVLAAVLGLSGCGGSKNGTPETTASSKSPSVQLEIGNTINYGSFGTTTDVDCENGKSLNVGGSNNTLKVKGTCESVNVLGADNRITIDKVDKSLTTTGINNTVTYHRGDPKLEDHGSGNTVEKG